MCLTCQFGQQQVLRLKSRQMAACWGCSGRDGRLGAVEGEPCVLEKVFAEEAVEGPKG